MVREILVVKRHVLFNGDKFEGFISCDEKDFMPMILGAHEYIERGSAEENPEWQQPIPYVWIINSKEKKAFVYRRAGDGGYSEDRLKSKWSCGIGGHIDRITDEDSDNPVIAAMLRELEEEVHMNVYSEPKIIGFINDDSDSIGRDHFGVVAVLEYSGGVEPNDKEMAEGRWMSVEEADELFARDDVEVEGWTKISWPQVKELLSS